MFGKYLPSLLVLTLLLASVPARAEAEPAPAERFTKAIVALYVTAEMCNQITALHSENFANVIRNYLTSYFQTTIPYWVLPEVQGHIKNFDSCVFRMRQGLDRYEIVSAEYAENYPDQPAPPALAAYFTQDNSNATGSTTQSSHYVTPSVITH